MRSANTAPVLAPEGASRSGVGGAGGRAGHSGNRRGFGAEDRDGEDEEDEDGGRGQEEVDPEAYASFALRADSARILFSLISSIYDMRKDQYAVMAANAKGESQKRGFGESRASPLPAPLLTPRRTLHPHLPAQAFA
jgi:hypothetical protein